MRIVKLIVVGLVILGGVYVALPAPGFPEPLDDAVQSMEEGDTEDVAVRRAYFTNHDREGVIGHYREQFGGLFTLRLNYPPEEAQTLIRDQTRSWYLEELVHPLRESVYVNGFIAQVEKDDIWYKGEHFEEKITIKYIRSGVVMRLVVYSMMVGVGYLLVKEWGVAWNEIREKL